MIAWKNNFTALITGIILFLSLSPRVFAVDPAVIPGWEKLDANQQLSLEQASDDALTQLRLLSGYGTEISDQYTALLLRDIASDEVSDAYARFYLGTNDADYSRRVGEIWLQMDLVENRLESALNIAKALELFTGESGYLSLQAQIHLLMGNVTDARSLLVRYLQSNRQQSSSEYARNVYLLSRLLYAEGSEQQAVSLIAEQYQDILMQDQSLAPDDRYQSESLEFLAAMLIEDSELTIDGMERDEVLSFLGEILSGEIRDAFPGPILLGSPGSIDILSALINEDGDIQDREDGDREASTNQSSDDATIQGGEDAGTLTESETPAESTGVVQVGSFSSRENAERFAVQVEALVKPVVVFYDGERYKVIIDCSDRAFIGSPNYNNPRRMLLELKEAGIEGFLIDDPR